MIQYIYETSIKYIINSYMCYKSKIIIIDTNHLNKFLFHYINLKTSRTGFIFLKPAAWKAAVLVILSQYL